jgi:phage tail sheath protein FI
MLLFNTRRSGYNVKTYQANYFNALDFPDDVLPTVKDTWLSASGNKDDGSMWAGRQAQRRIIVSAMKAGLDTSSTAREEQNQFNIIAAPGYPELTTNMIALSNERSNTLFVIGDTPMRLDAAGNSLVAWATNNNGLGLLTGDGQTATSNYAASFYPSAQTTDLAGNTVVVPPSHMMVRTILRSDAVSYPWLAPAGTRRGVVDNASAIGYIDSATGEFTQLAVGQAVRDILYERNVNPITFIPGVGITNFGNKTSTVTTTALDRINVARLVAFLRGRLDEIGKLFLFEPNDEITRNEIAGVINSLMVDLVAKRALYDYLVVCDTSNNTPARIDRNELYVDIAIEPVKSVEFIYIPLRIRNTGEIAGTA